MLFIYTIYRQISRWDCSGNLLSTSILRNIKAQKPLYRQAKSAPQRSRERILWRWKWSSVYKDRTPWFYLGKAAILTHIADKLSLGWLKISSPCLIEKGLNNSKVLTGYTTNQDETVHNTKCISPRYHSI